MGHRSQKLPLWMVVAVGVLAGFAGCGDSVKTPVQVHPPQIAPPPQSEPAPQLPITAKKKAPVPLSLPAPDGPERVAAQSQAAFDAGEQDFRAGHLGKAREEFDQALDGLLASGFDLDADPRLSGLYRHMIETVSADELEAFRDGDGFSEQKSTPAPIDEIAEQPIPQPEKFDPSLRGRAEGEVGAIGHDMPLTVNDQVLAYLNYFQTARGSAIVETGLHRAGRYRDMVRRVLKEEGVPEDLIYLAQAESAFQPQAVSKAGARGMWQFMSFAGRKYGLQKTWWVDERQDPEKATHAAARDLRDLYDQFGDWYLAMAAYNSGPGTVQAAVKRTGYADFWELYRRNVLPKETRNYVPIILAVTLMAKNPSQYGLDSVVMQKPDAYDTVTINYPVDLRLVAETVNSTVSDLQDLNPSLLRVTTPRDGKFSLHLPVGTKDQYETAIASIPPDMRLWWRYHTVHQGDTLVSLARSYHTTIKSINEVNHLDGGELETDAKLVIPVAPGKHPANETATYARRITRYKVHKGDTVESVADNFGISAPQLRRWNGLRGNSLAGRRVLALHLPISPTAHDAEVASSRSKSKSATPRTTPKTETATTKPPPTKSSEVERLETDKSEIAVVHHKVRSGETLYSIANAYRTTVAALKRDNRNIAVIRPGMILNVPVAR